MTQVPDNVGGNPKAVVEVTLLPSLEVRDVKLPFVVWQSGLR